MSFANWQEVVRKNPFNVGAMLVAADFLEEQGDPRAEWLRLYAQLTKTRAIDDGFFALIQQEATLYQTSEAFRDFLRLLRIPRILGVNVPEVQTIQSLMVREIIDWSDLEREAVECGGN